MCLLYFIQAAGANLTDKIHYCALSSIYHVHYYDGGIIVYSSFISNLKIWIPVDWSCNPPAFCSVARYSIDSLPQLQPYHHVRYFISKYILSCVVSITMHDRNGLLFLIRRMDNRVVEYMQCAVFLHHFDTHSKPSDSYLELLL